MEEEDRLHKQSFSLNIFPLHMYYVTQKKTQAEKYSTTCLSLRREIKMVKCVTGQNVLCYSTGKHLDIMVMSKR